MSTAFLVDSLLHAQRAQSYSDSQLKSSLSEMLLSRGQGEPAPEECKCNCAKRGYKCDKCREIREIRAESVDSIEEMEMDDDEDEEDEDEIVADIDSVEAPHLDEEELLDDELELQPQREAIKLPKVEPKEANNSSNSGTTTILKDNNSKPILKFSVSAILGDTREGVRVRNGKGGATQ